MSYTYGYETDSERNGSIFSSKIHGLQSNRSLVIIKSFICHNYKINTSYMYNCLWFWTTLWLCVNSGVYECIVKQYFSSFEPQYTVNFQFLVEKLR